MAKDRQRFGVLFRQNAKRSALPERRREVLDFTVDLHGDRCLQQSLADRSDYL
jgi:hypothetical protein